MRKTAVTLLLSVLFTVMLCGMGNVASARDLLSMENPPVKPGIEVLFKDEQFFNLVKGKRVGLITNPTGVNSDLVSTIDLLNDNPDINLVKMFAPEHGVRGDDYAGAQVKDSVDAKTGIPTFSLHGKTRRPPKEYLEGLDVMIYHIQDVGSRSYTYIYTMAYAMEECGKANIPFLVLDCPNPCGGNKVSGNILDESQGTSFVGLYAIPYMYGLTPGETAMLFNKEYNEVECNLTVVPMKGYKREMTQWDSGLPFIPSSPNVPSTKTAFYYNLTGIIGELFDVSIGVGYPLAFEVIAAPFIDRDEFVDALRKENMKGVKVRPITLKPYASRFKGEIIHGAQFVITDYRKVQPVEAQIHMMEVLQRLYPEKGLFEDTNKRRAMFDKVMGDKKIRHMIRDGKSAEEVIAYYQADVAQFMEKRAKYLMYK